MVMTPVFEAGNLGSIPSGNEQIDNVSEWLRRCAANALGFARAGSNPAVIDMTTCPSG